MEAGSKSVVVLVALLTVTTSVPAVSSQQGEGPVTGVQGPVQFTSESPSQSSDRDPTPHPPIVVTEHTGPTGFILGHDPVTGDPIYRPGSGVRDGIGTAEDPFVIEGWSTRHIRIQNTAAHVLITGNRIQGNEIGEPGLLLNRTENVEVRDNTVTNEGSVGSKIVQSEDVLVTGNHFRQVGTAIVLSQAREMTLVDNRIGREEATSQIAYGVSVTDSHRVAIRDNEVRGNVGYGIVPVQSSTYVTIRENTLHPFRRGIQLIETQDGSIAGNDLAGMGEFGMALYPGTEGIRIHNNTVEDVVDPRGRAGPAITVWGGGGHVISHNTLQDLGAGITLTNAYWLIKCPPLVDHSSLPTGPLLPARVQHQGACCDSPSPEERCPPVGIVSSLLGLGLPEGPNLHEYWDGAGPVHDLSLNTTFHWGLGNTTLVANEIASTDLGVAVTTDHPGLQVTDNNIDARVVGLSKTNGVNESQPLSVPADEAMNLTVTPEKNWWGCSEGPPHPNCTALHGSVQVDDPRSSPNPNAGVLGG